MTSKETLAVMQLQLEVLNLRGQVAQLQLERLAPEYEKLRAQVEREEQQAAAAQALGADPAAVAVEGVER